MVHWWKMAITTIFIHICLFKEPVQVILGKERRPIGCGHKRRVAEVENTMVYIPILDTIQHLLNNDALNC